MKFNITLLILAFIVLIVMYFAFSRENAKILTNKNDEFVFIDSDELLKRVRTNLNELKRILRRDGQEVDERHMFKGRIVRPRECEWGGTRGEYCGMEVDRRTDDKLCEFIVKQCPPGTAAIERGGRSCACAQLVASHGWNGGSRGRIDTINI